MHPTRLLIAVSALAISLNLAFSPLPAAAQEAPAHAMTSPCTGNINVVRVSDIKPGMMGKFLDAVAAQQAWYKNAGTTDEIAVMRIMEQDPDTKAWALSETQAITTHVMPAGHGHGPAHDAGYDAFVALYRDSSTIKETYVACMATK